ncbi:MAG TPA: SCO6880 family protein [Streptosporangiaceae bacterium]
MSTGTVPSKPEREPACTYFGWQQDRVAFLFGLSGQRATLIAVAVLAAIWPLAVARLAEGLLFWPLAAVLAVAAFARIAGRTADEWLAAAVSYSLLRLRDQHKFASGAFAPAASADPAAPTPMDLPGILAPVRILAARTAQGGPLAIVHHRYDRTYTAVAQVRFPGIGLADSARRDQRVAGWGGLLAGLCTEGNPIIRVQVLQRILPESGTALRRWHTDHRVPGAPPAAMEITQSLLETATLATCQREAFLAFVMDERRAGAAIRGAGGGSTGAAAVLARHLRALNNAIGTAELQVQGWLSPRDLAEVIRTAFDPHAIRPLAERRAAATHHPGHQPGLAPGVDPALAGPAAAEARPGSYVHDGAVSATYWVHDWPRSQVYATALAPLLGEGWHRRSFSLHLEPLGPRVAQRDVMRERTARDVAVRMRQRTGQLVPEHERAALDRARAQDAERAAGHGLVRFTAYVTVTVTDAGRLEDACAALEADAAAARIELRRMWLAQDVGFAMSALPLGFGLPRKRW